MLSTTNQTNTVNNRKILTRYQAHKEKQSSMIVAKVIISESELSLIIPDYDASYETNNPAKFRKCLYELGLDVSLPFERQDGLHHRNRLNKVVFCSRWIGDERQDENWIKSGYASKEAIDKYSGSKILEDLYRERNATQDTQDYLEGRDKYSVIDETVWE